jgi:hypothetical protein
MSKLTTYFLLACCLLIAGCGQPTSVLPVIEHVAYAQALTNGTYEIQLRYSITSSGGPCLSKDWFKTWTSYSTNWVYVKALDGALTADQIVVTSDAGKMEWPYAITNMQGTVSFTNATMTVQLEHPNYPDGVHMQGYAPYYLNGTYQVVTDSSPNTSRGCVKTPAQGE